MQGCLLSLATLEELCCCPSFNGWVPETKVRSGFGQNTVVLESGYTRKNYIAKAAYWDSILAMLFCTALGEFGVSHMSTSCAMTGLKRLNLSSWYSSESNRTP